MKLSEKPLGRRATRKQGVELVNRLQEKLLEAANLATLIAMNGSLPNTAELLDKDVDFMIQVNWLSNALALDLLE